MYDKIDNLDLSYVFDELTDAERGGGFTAEKAKDAITSYRFFLKLRAKHSKDELVPTETIDKVWHSHILHTERYTKDCNDIFGRYIHHRPSFKKSPAELKRMKEKFKLTQKLMFEEFGTPLENLAMGFCLDPSESCCCWEVL